jgi:hypothetical protein
LRLFALLRTRQRRRREKVVARNVTGKSSGRNGGTSVEALSFLKAPLPPAASTSLSIQRPFGNSDSRIEPALNIVSLRFFMVERQIGTHGRLRFVSNDKQES